MSDTEIIKEEVLLEWGQTPWDNMTREELLREVWRMWVALTSVAPILEGDEQRSMGHPFWGKDGCGGRAMEQARQVIEPIAEVYDTENLYRAFFRYAPDLLFQQRGVRLGFGWAICPVCGDMYGRRADGVEAAGTRCDAHGLRPNCPGVLRPITWADLRPDADNRSL